MELPTEFLAGLGRVVLRWSLLEHNLAAVTMDLIGASGGEAPVRSVDIAISLVKELRFRALAIAALNVYRARIGEDAGFEQLSAIIKRAEKLADERNQLVHATYSLRGTKVALWKVSAKRKGIRRVSRFIEARELESLADQIGQLSNDLLALLHCVIAEGKIPHIRMT